jgi:predicted phosphodiesterase
MKIGIFSDVHANLEAFQAVIEAYKQEQINVYYSLGDTVGYGANPNECSYLTKEISSVTLLGNHDAAVTGNMDYSYYYEAAQVVLDWHAGILDEENMKWLKSLSYTHSLDDLEITLCHGSPRNLKEFEYIFALDQARELLSIYDNLSWITFIGHSHLYKVFLFTPNKVQEIKKKRFYIEKEYKYLISVGSVGQPRDYDHRAGYAIFDTKTKEFVFKRVEYDIEKAAQKIFDLNFDRNFGHRLFLGV